MHNSCFIRDFEVLDVFGIELRDEQKDLQMVLQDKVAYGKGLTRSVTCKTVVDIETGKPYLISGVFKLTPNLAEAFMMVDKDFPLIFKSNAKLIIREIKKNMVQCNVYRLQVLVREDFKVGQRFVESLGFEAEGVCRGMSLDRSNMILYSWINKNV